MTLRPLILASLFFFAVAPAHAADAVLRDAEVDSLDAYRDRVAWVEDDGKLWTAERGAAVTLGVTADGRVDVAAGPDGKPVAVYRRGSKFHLYDFAAGRERTLKSPGKVDNWAFWKDRFAVIRGGRLQVGGRDVGRAKSLRDKAMDFNGTGVAYVNLTTPDPDVEEFSLAYWPATGPGAGRTVMRVAHGASGDLSLDGPVLSATKAYATQRGGEFGGPWRLWRVDLKTGKRDYAGLPSEANSAVPLGATQVVAYVCAKDPCRLIVRSVTWRR